MLPKLLENPLYHVKMALAQVLNINENVIQVYDDENVELPSWNLVDIILEAG